MAHLDEAVEGVARGALPEPVALAVRQAFEREDRGWSGQV
jgi:hypothetical protein